MSSTSDDVLMSLMLERERERDSNLLYSNAPPIRFVLTPALHVDTKHILMSSCLHSVQKRIRAAVKKNKKTNSETARTQTFLLFFFTVTLILFRHYEAAAWMLKKCWKCVRLWSQYMESSSNRVITRTSVMWRTATVSDHRNIWISLSHKNCDYQLNPVRGWCKHTK